MAKLVEIAAKNVKEWPQRATHLVIVECGWGKGIVASFTQCGPPVFRNGAWTILHPDCGADVFWLEKIDDSFGLEELEENIITRAQWEAERARIALNNDIRATVVSDLEGLREIGLATDDDVKEAKRLAMNQQATAEAREIARTGAMTSEEKDLTDIACGKRSKEDQALWDKVLLQQLDKMTKRESAHHGEFDADVAIAFERTEHIIAERAKRLKGV